MSLYGPYIDTDLFSEFLKRQIAFISQAVDVRANRFRREPARRCWRGGIKWRDLSSTSRHNARSLFCLYPYLGEDGVLWLGYH